MRATGQLRRVQARQLIAAWVLGGLLSACGPASAATPTPERSACQGVAIVIGEVSDDPGSVRTSTQPLADYLAARLQPQGIACGDVDVRQTSREMIGLLERGEVDVYFDSPYRAALASQAAGAPPGLRRWLNCDPDYASVLLVRKDSGIDSLEDLRGKMVAMDNPESTASFALAASYLIDQGLKLSVKPNFKAAVGPDEVGIWFSGDDTNSMSAVARGLVQATVTDDYRFTQLTPTDEQAQLSVLWQSEPVDRQLVLFRPGLSIELRAAIKQALVDAHGTAEGEAALAQGAETCKFDEQPLATLQANLAHMLEIADKVANIPGLP